MTIWGIDSPSHKSTNYAGGNAGMNKILVKKYALNFIKERTTDYVHLLQEDCYNFKSTMKQFQSLMQANEVRNHIKGVWVHSIRVRDGVKLKNGIYLSADEMALLTEAEVDDMIKKVVSKLDFKMIIETTKEDMQFIF